MNYNTAYNKWLESDKLTVSEKNILKELSNEETEDSFYCDLEFGTGGLRGVMGLGTHIPDDFMVVYTPLHGSGNVPVRRILAETGVKNVFVVPEQEQLDGDFPTVQSPNPENSEAFDIAIGYAAQQNADLIFGTDPDSDRIGVVVNTAARR